MLPIGSLMVEHRLIERARALGLKHEEAHSFLLFTLGKQNTEEEIQYVLSLLLSIVKKLRAISPLTPKELMS